MPELREMRAAVALAVLGGVVAGLALLGCCAAIARLRHVAGGAANVGRAVGDPLREEGRCRVSTRAVMVVDFLSTTTEAIGSSTANAFPHVAHVPA